MGLEDFKVADGGTDAALVNELGDGAPENKKGRDAEFEFGVCYQGPFETYRDGVNIAVRRHARALDKAGVPVFLRSENFTQYNMGVATTVEYCELPPVLLREVDHMTTPRYAHTSVHVRHVVPTLNKLESIVHPRAESFLSAEDMKAYLGRTVLFSAWEEDHIPDGKVRCLNKLGQIWVTSTAAEKWLSDSGVDSSLIRVIPHPFYGKDPIANIGKRRAGRPYRFLNISKWEPRKGQHDLIGGYLKAFRPGMNTELVLKLSPYAKTKGYPDSYGDSISFWLEDEEVRSMGWSSDNVAASVRVLWKAEMSRSDLAALYSECDCYVSAGRSEGFDLPAFDAKLSGMRVVRADSGGPADFCTNDDIVIGGDHTKREPFHGFYDFEGCTWDGYNSYDMSLALEKAYNKRLVSPKPFDRSPFTMTAVGEKMKQCCFELAPELEGE